MGFTTLDRASAPTASEVPANGVVIGRRAAGRSGKRANYLAIKVGPTLARSLGCHAKEQGFAVQLGHGADAGKLALSLDVKSKFVAKKQTGGHYMLTVPARSLAGHLDVDKWPERPHVVEAPRLVPAQGNAAPMCIVKLPDLGGVVGSTGQ